MKEKNNRLKRSFLKSWGAVYALMTVVLALLMLFFYWFTKHFQ